MRGLTSLAIVALGLSAGAVGVYATLFNPSELYKRLPHPPLEQVVLSGTAVSGSVIDCGGGWYNGGRLTELVIRSTRTAAGWERPENIVIQNCRIRGAIRVMGLGRNGEAEDVRESSLQEGHTRRAQQAAPTNIRISGVEIEAVHRIPLYLAPGVTDVVFENSRITGWGASTAIYLDCETAGNRIAGNTLAMRAAREVIAVDGSADNVIEGNRFENITYGGIFLYRNCGEAGTVRHQTPHGNVIRDNWFDTRTLGAFQTAIHLGSRNGGRTYCRQDDGHPFGSSLDDRDFADDNTVIGNVFAPPTPRAIHDEGARNTIDGAPLAAASTTGAGARAVEMLRWSELPGLPDPIGVAGPFVGVHAGAIIVAGGANFPVADGAGEADRWQAVKVWHDACWVLAGGPGGPATWRAVEPFGRRVAYGASASTPQGVVCVGGDDGTRVFDTVTLLSWDPAAGRVGRTPLPALPQPLTCGGAAAIGSVVYVACGQQGLGLDTAGAALYRLDVSALRRPSSAAWERLADVPGGPRAFPVVVARHDGTEPCVYVMSGRRAAGKPGEIEPLCDVQEFAPRGGGAWRRRAELPRAVMAGTAVAVGQEHVFILSGDDGERWREVDTLRDAHPGFPRRSLAYHTITDTWIDGGPMPANQVATTAVRWGDAAVIVSGEVRPRHRTPAAWMVEPVAGLTVCTPPNDKLLEAE
jgi:parallel beta-helix repeat protein